MNNVDDGLTHPPKRSRWSRFKTHLAQDVDEQWGDIILILCTFLSGLIDSAIFNVWSCFVSMQTGNTVYVGLGVSGQPFSQPMRWAKSGTAIISFSVGAFFFSRLHRFLGPLHRGTLSLSCFCQATFCFISCLLVVSAIVPDNAGDLLPDNFIVLLPLSLLSFQAGAQIVMSRVLEYGELTTVVLTSAYADVMIDPNLFSTPVARNVKRNRRVCSVAAMLFGAVCGGFLSKRQSVVDPLWIAGLIKMCIAITWLFWRGKGGIRLE